MGVVRTQYCRWHAALALVAVCLFGPVAGAQPAANARQAAAAPERGPGWAALTPEQRSALGPLQGDWPTIDAAGKQKWIEVASRFPSMSPDERERIRVRMVEWVRLTPAERGRARLQFQEARQLTPQDRQAHWEAYLALPPADRAALAAKAAPEATKPVRTGPPDARPPADSSKRNVIVTPPPPAKARPVAPAVIQARPGVTTTLVSKSPKPPAHHQTGMPKIAATTGFVDPSTLLPKRGPQGAAVVAAPAAAASGRSSRP